MNLWVPSAQRPTAPAGAGVDERRPGWTARPASTGIGPHEKRTPAAGDGYGTPTVRTNDVETYYERRGSGPVVRFVHAAILDRSRWDPQVERLCDEYTTIAYDIRGHGRTGGSAREAYSIDLLADDLDALVTALGLDRPVVCGHSTGGCIAQVFAATHPDRLSGLVLADTFSPELFDRREWFQRSLLIEGTGAGGDYRKVETLRREGPGMTTDEFAEVIRAVASFHETTVDLSSIAVPTLVLYGEEVPPFVRRHAPTLGAEIPNATVREVPGAGHAANLDDPEFFTDAVRELLAQAYPADAGPAPADAGIAPGENADPGTP